MVFVLNKYGMPIKMGGFILLGTLTLFSSFSYASTLSDSSTIKIDNQNLGSIFTSQSVTPIIVESGKNLSGKIDLVSNYIFRGISQTQNQPAAQVGLAYSFLSTGMYGCIFGSNDHFLGKQNETIYYEVDPSIGVTNKVNDHAMYDFNLSRYIYPQANSNDYNAFNSYFNYYFLTAQFSYSNDDYATGKSGSYYNLGFKYEIPSRYFFHINNLNVSGGIGYSSLPKNVGLQSYKDFNLALSKSINRFTFMVQWTDTDNRATNAASLKGNKVIGIISASI